MTVGELAAALARYPADYEVQMASGSCCAGDECDGHEPEEFRIADVRLADPTERGLVVMLHW